MNERKTVELGMEELELVTWGLRLVHKELAERKQDMPCTAYGDPLGDQQKMVATLKQRLNKPYKELLDHAILRG
jgi:hypothetical protein